MQKTYNFKLEKDPNEINLKYVPGEFRDERNGIICINPTVDIPCYINYLELLNGCISEWKSFGYLDLGMMPVSMGPSFMQNTLNEVLLKLASNLDLTCYQMPAVSQLYSTCKLAGSDVWVFREDAARVMGVSSDKLQAVDFIGWVVKM